MAYVNMNNPAAYLAALFTVLIVAASAETVGGERLAADTAALVAEQPTSARTATAVLNSPAMLAMLRADRDKDGLLSREELDDYDLLLGRRFSEADVDRNGRLTLRELETLLLLAAPEAPSVGATR